MMTIVTVCLIIHIPLLLFLAPLATTLDHNEPWRYVALHAQSKSSVADPQAAAVGSDEDADAAVVGSEITCAGMAAAFRNELPARLVASHGDTTATTVTTATHVHIFAPFHYDKITGPEPGQTWQLIVIEGYFAGMAAFLHEARRHNPGVVILYFCLDDQLPGTATLRHLDFDGILTNSASVARALAPRHTKLLHLAADAAVARSVHSSVATAQHSDDAAALCRGDACSNSSHPEAIYAHNVVYVGGFPGLASKPLLRHMLLEAAPFGLAVYGQGWQDAPQPLRSLWRGVLPPSALYTVYRRSRIVLGATLAHQAQQGMINNRVFEALAGGAVLISDHFEALHRLAGANVLYVHAPGDTARLLQRVLGRPGVPGDAMPQADPNSWAAHATEWILQHHTWQHRVADILSFASTLRTERHRRSTMAQLQLQHAAHVRPTAPGVLLLFDSRVAGPASPTVGLTLWPALHTLRQQYRFAFADAAAGVAATLSAVRAVSSGSSSRGCLNFAMVWVVDHHGAPAARVGLPTAAFQALRPELCSHTRSAIVLLTPDEPLLTASMNATPPPLGDFDVVYYPTPDGRLGDATLEHRRAVHAFGLDAVDACTAPAGRLVAATSVHSIGTVLTPASCLHGVRVGAACVSPMRAHRAAVAAAAGAAARTNSSVLYIGNIGGSTTTTVADRVARLRLASPKPDVLAVELTMLHEEHEHIINNNMAAQKLRRAGVRVVTGGVAPQLVLPLFCAAQTVYFPTPQPGEGLTMALAAMVAGAAVRVEPDATELIALSRVARLLTTKYYASRLALGVGHALALGRAHSSISFGRITLAQGSTSHVVLALPLLVQQFLLGQDGCACVDIGTTAHTAGDSVPQPDAWSGPYCVLQPHMEVQLALRCSAPPVAVWLRAKLSSNLYRDTIVQTEPIAVTLPATTCTAVPTRVRSQYVVDIVSSKAQAVASGGVVLRIEGSVGG